MNGISAGGHDGTPALVPADWQATEIFFRYPIAAKVRDGRIETAKPIRRELSQGGLSGTWYFAFGNVRHVDIPAPEMLFNRPASLG